MRLALAQLNPLVGAIDENVRALADAYHRAVDAGADLVVAGELGVPGYPSEDLVRKPAFVAANEAGVAQLAGEVGLVPLVVGFVEAVDETTDGQWQPFDSAAVGLAPLANAAAVLREGACTDVYRKRRLPNYGVFDEARYFVRGSSDLVVDVAGVRVGVVICEDLWGEGGPASSTAAAGAELLVVPNGSPYTRTKGDSRVRWSTHHANHEAVWLGFCNQVGGQDEVVFDGASFVCAPDGRVAARAAQFHEDLLLVDLPVGDLAVRDGELDEVRQVSPVTERLDPLAEVWAALVLAVGDYVRKNGFTGVLVGLSGGIDSAVTAAVAVDALGADAVTCVGMPSPHSSPGSLSDARQLAQRAGCPWLELPIGDAMAAFDAALAEPFAGTEPGTAEENLQARIRGTLLMALSNKRGDMVLAPGNKSEYAVGYSTLYGDMAGGFAVIKDVPKTLVWELARWRNTRGDGEMIPVATIEKDPSAELRPDQRDTDSLLPYDVLDVLIEGLVEDDRSVADLVADGHAEADVREVQRLIDRAEYKRRQSAPGVKITDRAFGKDRRLPITQAWSG